MGAKSLTAHSSFPKTKVENPISHAINGGLVKYPKSIFLDQCQYCASSTDNSIGDTYKEYILKIVIDIKIKRTIGVPSNVKLSLLLRSDNILISQCTNYSIFNKITILLWVSSLKTNKAYVLDLLYN